MRVLSCQMAGRFAQYGHHMPTVGEYLRQAREAQKLTVHEVAEKTKIRTDHIRALEEGNYDVFSAPVYIKGFVRNYAGVLKLDVGAVLQQLDTELSGTEKFNEPPRLTGESRTFVDLLLLQLSKINWRVAAPVFVIAAGLVISLFTYRYWQQKKTENPLKNLGPGIYAPSKKQSGETLPIPITPPRTNKQG
jgi:cytoskeletal protein RodZ